MKIAIPLENGKLSPHFGHSQAFAIVIVNPVEKTIISRDDVAAPPHSKGAIPKWMGDNDVDIVIAGNMGNMARNLLAESGIIALIGAPIDTPEALIEAYFAESIKLTANMCSCGGGCGH